MALAAIIALLTAPLAACLAIGAALDVGGPVLFWQQRVGRDGKPIQIYKFRTMRAPFDRRGDPVAPERRVSRFGAFLRATRLDEWPQLYNVLVGDMAFVGPRPLLSADQPKDARLRLSVVPGLTGWAQIHGGKLVTPEEKNALDVWYVRNASLSLDARILCRTVLIMLSGDARNEAVLETALRAHRDGGPAPSHAQRTSEPAAV